mgnify:CR=1 FL=1
MAEGARADLICPPDHAYGDRGFGNLIPPNSPLLFSIEVVKIESANKEQPKKVESKNEDVKETDTSKIDTSKFKVTLT